MQDFRSKNFESERENAQGVYDNWILFAGILSANDTHSVLAPSHSVLLTLS